MDIAGDHYNEADTYDGSSKVVGTRKAAAITKHGFTCGRDHVWRRRQGLFLIEAERRNVHGMHWRICFGRGARCQTLKQGTHRHLDACLAAAIKWFNANLSVAAIPEPDFKLVVRVRDAETW